MPSHTRSHIRFELSLFSKHTKAGFQIEVLCRQHFLLAVTASVTHYSKCEACPGATLKTDDLDCIYLAAYYTACLGDQTASSELARFA